MAKPKPNPEREELHQRVERLWDLLVGEEDSDIDREIVSILGQLSLGLDKLAMGEVPEIFRPGPKNPRVKGAPPSVAREKRWRAVFYVEFLRRCHKKKIPAPKAIEHVAEAFAIKPDILAYWRKLIMSKDGKTSWVAKSRRQIEERIQVARSRKLALAKVLEEAIAEGKRFKSVGS
jgi:hypothetical protein